MKKIYCSLALAFVLLAFTACSNNTGSHSGATDSSAGVTHPADNNSATNPSLADTGYSRNHADSSVRRNDSSRKQ